jgi:zinc and cadmium transporter
MGVWINTIVSVLVVSLISLVGVFTFALNDKKLKNILLFLVSLSAGSLFGGAFVHLIPEASGELGFRLMSLYVLAGLLLFFVLEKFMHWRHCHIPTSKSHPHPLGTMNLIGDGLHNFIDGMLIAASYMIGFPVGFATTLAVIFHEIPQEIGDFGVLIHAGFSKAKALFFNFLSALTAVLGAVVTLLIGAALDQFTVAVVAVTAGGFIYIAGSDLIPELKKEVELSRTLGQFCFLVLGIAIMFALTFLE